MAEDPKTLLGLFEAGVRRVAPVFIVGPILVGVGFLVWPKPETFVRPADESDIALRLLRRNPDGGRAHSEPGPVHLSEPVMISADLPYSGTVAVVRVGPGGQAARIWPPDPQEPARSSAGKSIALTGEIVLGGDAGVQTWMLSLCQLGSDALACTVGPSGAPSCPEGCGAARLDVELVP